MLSESNYNFVINPVRSTHYEDKTKFISNIFAYMCQTMLVSKANIERIFTIKLSIHTYMTQLENDQLLFLIVLVLGKNEFQDHPTK